MLYLNLSNQNYLKPIYNQTANVLSSSKGIIIKNLNPIWTGTKVFCSSQKTNLFSKIASIATASSAFEAKLIKDFSSLSFKMKANENFAIGMVITCNAVFILALDLFFNAYNWMLDAALGLQPGRVKSIKDILLNDIPFAIYLMLLNQVVVETLLDYSLGKWAYAIVGVSTVVRHQRRRNRENFEMINTRIGTLSNVQNHRFQQLSNAQNQLTNSLNELRNRVLNLEISRNEHNNRLANLESNDHNDRLVYLETQKNILEQKQINLNDSFKKLETDFNKQQEIQEQHVKKSNGLLAQYAKNFYVNNKKNEELENEIHDIKTDIQKNAQATNALQNSIKRAKNHLDNLQKQYNNFFKKSNNKINNNNNQK